MRVLAIDPGCEESAYVLYDSDAQRPIEFGKPTNADLLAVMREDALAADRCVIEMVASYGMAVGREVFETVYWLGRFAEAWDRSVYGVTPHERLYRRDVKMCLCGVNNAKDSNIRAALIDRFGPGKNKAVGLKATPGPLYGVKADVWQALAVAVTYGDTRRKAG